MRCVVQEMCWPDGDSCWKPGSVVDVSPEQFNLLGKFLKPVTRPRVVTKDVKDGAEK